MICPLQARILIRRHIPKPKVEVTPLSECFGSVLAGDIKALFSLPIADNSAMDGFAIRSRDALDASSSCPVRLRIAGMIKAGESKKIHMARGTTYKIMTGALIPKGADSVVAKEEAVITKDYLVLHHPIVLGQHIRRRSEEIKEGQRILKKGMILNAPSVGMLASFGYANIPIYQKPKVAIIATGSELVSPGSKLSWGKIYDSNSWMIRCALAQMGLKPSLVMTLSDEKRRVQVGIRKGLCQADYLLLLGGISVGDYDVVKDCLARESVKTIFWRVNQKPGKPLYFGLKNKKIFFGLPGNPAAALTCFYEYVYPALRQTMGFKNPALRSCFVTAGTILRDATRHLFLKAKVVDRNVAGRRRVKTLCHQGSHMLSSLCEGDGFLLAPPANGKISSKHQFEFHFLPERSYL